MPKLVKFLVTVMGCPDGRGGDFTVQEGEERIVCDDTFEILRWKRTFANTPWIVDHADVVRPEGEYSEGTRDLRRLTGDNRNRHGYVELYSRRERVGDA